MMSKCSAIIYNDLENAGEKNCVCYCLLTCQNHISASKRGEKGKMPFALQRLSLGFWFLNFHIREKSHEVGNFWIPTQLLSTTKHQESVCKI